MMITEQHHEMTQFFLVFQTEKVQQTQHVFPFLIQLTVENVVIGSAS